MAKQNRLDANTPENIMPVTVSVPAYPVDKDQSFAWSGYKKWFFISLAAMLGILWMSGFNVGLCSDEMDMAQYGKANYSYYFSGGKDTSFLNLHQPGDTAIMKTLPYYGSNFEYLATGINYLTRNLNGKQEYNVRHALNQLFVVLAILFTGLCTTRLSNYRAALIASWLLFLTPTFTGWGLFDTKDLPFATGYIATLYFIIRFLEQIPRPTWKASIYLMLALAFTIGIRIGGVLLIMYFILFAGFISLSTKELRKTTFNKTTLPPLFLKITTAIAGALLIAILLWPYVLIDPAHNFIAALNSAKKFPADIKMNFKGVEIHSTELPQNYLLTYLTITIPVFLLAAFSGSVILLATGFRKIKALPIALILLAALFPIVYAIQSGLAMYNGWRHVLFFYPAFVVITGLGIENLLSRIGKQSLQFAVMAICIIGMAHPIAWSIKNHPYEYLYYNESEGFDKAYYDYENDVWSISVLPAIDWLMKNEKLTDSTIIGSNTAYFVRDYLKAHYPGTKIKVIPVSAKNYWSKKWDYMLLNTIFLPTGYLQNDYPPENTIHTIDAGGHPITAIVKDPAQIQYEISQLILKADFRKSDSLANQYMNSTKKINPYMYGAIAITKAMMSDYTAGAAYGNKAVLYNPDDLFGHSALAFISYKQNNIEEAVNQINICLSLAPEDAFVLQLTDSISAKIPK